MSEFVALDDPRLWEARRMKAGPGALPAGRAKRGARTSGSALPTVGELERLQEQACTEGRAEGLAEGRAGAAQEADRLRALATSLEQARDALDNEVAEDLLALALDIARAVLHEALPV